MALTVASVAPFPGPSPVGQHLEKIVDVTFDSSYPTGGEDLTPATLGLRSIIDIPMAGDEGGTAKYAVYDRSTQKLLLHDGASGQVANASDQSAVVVRLTVKGI